jgi:UDP-glucose 4-epimerase
MLEGRHVMSKKVIVTGGAGFIGSHTAVQLVQAGYTPIVIDNFCNSERLVLGRLQQILNAQVKLHAVDCGDRAAMDRVFAEEGEVYGLIHFAAHKAVGASMKQPLEYYRNNLGSLVTVLSAMAAAQVRRFVFSSSCTVYGQPDVLPVTEQSPIKTAESPYGRTKQFCEDIIADHVTAGSDIGAVILRYFNPAGAHPSALIGELPLGAPENLVPYITQTAVGIRQQLTVFGDDYDTPDGTCIRDYIHVVDLAAAHVKALEWIDRQPPQPSYEVFNVGTGKGSSVLEMIHAFEEASGTKLNYKIGPRRPGDVVQTYADVSKSTRELGWKAERGILEAMGDAYRWQLTLPR